MNSLLFCTPFSRRAAMVRVGTVFMDHYYIELDPVNMKIGIAPSIY